MTGWRSGFWIKAGMIGVAVVVPFGTLVVAALAAHQLSRKRAASNGGSDHAYEEWRRLRDQLRP